MNTQFIFGQILNPEQIRHVLTKEYMLLEMVQYCKLNISTSQFSTDVFFTFIFGTVLVFHIGLISTYNCSYSTKYYIHHHHHFRFWYLRCCGCPGLRGGQHLNSGVNQSSSFYSAEVGFVDITDISGRRVHSMEMQVGAISLTLTF